MKHTGPTALVLAAIPGSTVFTGSQIFRQDIAGLRSAETPLINDRFSLFVGGYLVFSAPASDAGIQHYRP